jgi:hypothetical protein
VVLARTPAHLGKLFTPIGDLPFDVEPNAKTGDDKQKYVEVQMPNGNWVLHSFMESPLSSCLATEYSKELEDKSGGGKTKLSELNESNPPKDAWLAWLDGKIQRATDPREKERLVLYDRLIRDYGLNYSIHESMVLKYGHAFRRLEVYKQVEAWTDDYSDVMRVMMIPELQMVRKFFGLPTPVER